MTHHDSGMFCCSVFQSEGSLQNQFCIVVKRIKSGWLDDNTPKGISDALMIFDHTEEDKDPKSSGATPQIVLHFDWPPQISQSCVPSSKEESDLGFQSCICDGE